MWWRDRDWGDALIGAFGLSGALYRLFGFGLLGVGLGLGLASLFGLPALPLTLAGALAVPGCVVLLAVGARREDARLGDGRERDRTGDRVRRAR
jgi:hypothetical protein